ncbi:MAG: response regulator transcription factor [Chloroflexota bacterium]
MSRILIVDDDEDLVELMSELLKDAGHQVEGLTEGQQAYAHVKATHPDLVLLDLMMPEVGGLDELKLLRDDADLRDLPVILVTADQQFVDDQANRVTYGITDCVAKPFALTDLLERIESALK